MVDHAKEDQQQKVHMHTHKICGRLCERRPTTKSTYAHTKSVVDYVKEDQQQKVHMHTQNIKQQ